MDAMTFGIPLEHFIERTVQIHLENPDQRFGQVLFNHLAVLRPDISEALRGSLIDPFHRDAVKQETWDFITDKWDDVDGYHTYLASTL